MAQAANDQKIEAMKVFEFLREVDKHLEWHRNQSESTHRSMMIEICGYLLTLSIFAFCIYRRGLHISKHRVITGTISKSVAVIMILGGLGIITYLYPCPAGLR